MEAVITKLTDLLEQQTKAMNKERTEATGREERMQAMLEDALRRLPHDDNTAAARAPNLILLGDSDGNWHLCPKQK